MKRSIIIIACVVAVAVMVAVGVLWHDLNTSPFHIDETAYIYVRPGDDVDVVTEQLRSEAHADNVRGWNMATTFSGYEPRSGRYAVHPGEKMLTVFRRLKSGSQEPVRLTLPSTRGLHRIAGCLGRRLMVDSAFVMQAFADTTYVAELGYTPETLPALFIPDTYEVYWDIPLDKLMERLVRENEAFWEREGRSSAADSLGMTREEVYTLASIVDEETAANAEKPDVARLYLNRLNIGMPLQADPTVKFAVGDETLRRIRNNHLDVESAYNTYRNIGLPPGPIRIASQAGIDAVLHPSDHTYLYMCAREDFSGRHNFATTYAQHQQNARRYQRALNARGIR